LILKPKVVSWKTEEMSVLMHVGTALSFYFNEIIIKSNVKLITSNQLSDMGEVGEVQPDLVHRVQRMEHWVAN